MILHIFKKDVRRLLLPVGLTWVLLAVLARTDRWRSDWMTGSLEGWLDLLLPMGWVCLIALVVDQEPLAGDRNFWTTRPYRRGPLLAAKLLFVALLIQLPLFLADAYILAARGFAPSRYLPQLLWQQAVLFAALVMPALALASLVRSFTHFMLAVFGVCALVALIVGGFPGPPLPRRNIEEVRRGLVIIVIALVACLVVLMQFTQRKMAVSRTLGAVGALGAAAISVYLSASSAYALRSVLSPIHGEVSIHLATRDQVLSPFGGPESRRAVFLPVSFDGIPQSGAFNLEVLSLEVVAANGERFRPPSLTQYRPFDKVVLNGYFWPSWFEARGPSDLMLSFDRASFERLKNGKAKVIGTAAVGTYRAGETGWMSTPGSADVPGIGHCSSTVQEDSFSFGMLRVECESPSTIPRMTEVRLWHPDTGREWRQRLGDSAPNVAGPRGAWLSPLERRQTYFRLAINPQGSGSQWEVPQSDVRTAKIAITPRIAMGSAVVHFQFDDVDLSAFAVKP
jgi:hypothetical protein